MGKFQEIFKRLFCTPSDLDNCNFLIARNYPELIKKFKEKYGVDEIGA